MADAIPLKLVDNGDGTGKLVQFATGETIPLDNLAAALKLLGGLVPAAGLPYFKDNKSAALASLSDKALELLAKASTADMLKLLGAAGAGANKDITSLEGLTTALPIAQGGTGATTGLDALNGLLGARFTEQPTIAPSLLLDFVNRGTLDARMTFERMTPGTCYGPDGKLRIIAADQPRFDHDPVTRARRGLLIEEARSNQLTATQDLSRTWIGSRATALPRMGASPDGGYGANKLVEDNSSNSTHQLTQNTSFKSGWTYAFSMYAKAGERSIVQLAFNGAAFSTPQRAAFDLAKGLPGVAQGSPEIGMTPVGGGWYRIWMVAAATATGVAGCILYLTDATGAVSYSGDAMSGAYFWGGQLEVGTFPTSYIPSIEAVTARTTTATYFDQAGILRTAAAGIARQAYGFDGQRWSPAGLVVEGAATNVVLASQTFNHEKWVSGAGGSAQAVDNTTISPDGTKTAATITDSVTTEIQGLQQGLAITSSAGGQTASVYMKAGTSSIASMRFTLSGGSSVVGEVAVNLATGAAMWRGGVAGFRYLVQAVGSGWYRVSITLIDNNSGNVNANLEFRPAWASTLKDAFESTATGSIYLWGAQAEAGYYATSYIPTTTDPVTRAADSVTSTAAMREWESITLPLAGWYNFDEGTVAANWFTQLSGQSKYPWSLEGAGSLLSMYDAGQQTGMFAMAGSAVLHQVEAGRAASGRQRAAYAFAANEFALSLNGDAPVTAASAVMPQPTALRIGNRNAGDRPLNGHLRHLRYFPKRLTNTELQALSA